MKQPLANVKVLDFTRVLAGPYCTMLLGDMGAEVIKIEKPGIGDDTRSFGPFKNNESGYFMFLNRGKKSIALDLKQPESIGMIKELVKEADVIVENFRPGVMDKLGLDYDSLQTVNPRIIYTSISGFGQYGPYSQRPAYDLVAQAMGGLASITGHPDQQPTRAGASLGDMSAALYAAFGIMVALFHREQTGEGQYIDIAMVDSIFSMLESNVMRYTAEGMIPERIGSRHPISSPFDIYEAQDGYIVIAVANDSLFKRLCAVMKRPELEEDERFHTDAQRTHNEAALKVIIEEWLQGHTVKEAVELINNGGVPSSPILNIDEICENKHTKVREMLVEMDHPIAGKVRIPGNPVKLSKTPPVIDRPSPGLGEHTDEIIEQFKKVRN
ncbi:CaiB/BaiF CoA transferase family protein [Bacillus chungangensis]|uniref:Crotonobetainyl-CoA:carnitine CoA-transferase CaiB-like acyl-CoA transferase n=1 Tax=Bacillus chungangensis TaxID=587633 RepID=A0ABT9WPU3_9BACI|nr:CoA transferase [Bacillus chungangensis]MDQ0175311.1 crotonobetainyl-CoA:carnitine CoA-transferase CaiB-like acyl-CoA transferase [Bacillus chungangensis]